MVEPIDQFDRKILDLVQRNCQLKAEAIAEVVGLSASAVQRRLKRLRIEGVIVAEVAIIDRKATKNSSLFIAGLEIEREHYDAVAKFKQWASKNDNIQQVYYVTGAVDIIVLISARDASDYDDIAVDLMAHNPQIKKIVTNVVLKELKLGMYIPVDQD